MSSCAGHASGRAGRLLRQSPVSAEELLDLSSQSPRIPADLQGVGRQRTVHHSQWTGNDLKSVCRSRVQHACSQKYCDGAAAQSPAAPASSSLSPVSRSICAGSQLQRPQKLRVTGLIGYGQVSLLSVALLASKGWTFSCSPGKSCSRTFREVDKPAKPPCLSLSHFGGHDQVPNRTGSSGTHLDIFLWYNVPWISIVHPGVVAIHVRC